MPKGEYYILKMDISKYFDSINKSILLNILKRKIKDEKVIWLLKKYYIPKIEEKALKLEIIHHRCLATYN